MFNKKEKSTWHIYLNNTIAYLLFKVLKIIFNKPAVNNKHILFINTGQIGDLTVSSVIFRNFNQWRNGVDLYFLINHRYLNLFQDYTGPINIIGWNYNLYKYNLLYRITFLMKLRKVGFGQTINLTAARGITNDEIALLSGASEIICITSNWKYLKKLFGERMDKEYNKVLKPGSLNEYEKHIYAIKYLTKSIPHPGTIIYINQSTEKKIREFLNKIVPERISSIITIAPMTDIPIKNWDISNYQKLIMWILSKYDARILLLGNKTQYNIYENLSRLNERKVINLAGKFTIIESAALVRESSIFIGNDSGFTHIAKALNKKYIGIIGGGSYNHFFPYNVSINEVLLSHKMDCFGCEWSCKYDKPYCHFNVTVEEVCNNISKMIFDNQRSKLNS